ncbi:hypothetical protein RFI_38560, partial [Reticulomyxa filosa]
KQYVIEFVDEVAQKDFEKKEEDTKAIFQQWMEGVLDSVNTSVNTSNFLEAENKIKLIRRIVGILGDHFKSAPSILPNNDGNGDEGDNDTKREENEQRKSGENSGNIKTRVDTLEKTIENKLKEIVKQYQAIQLKGQTSNPYSSFPPKELYEKLKRVMETNAMYKETWNKIQEDITRKIREFLCDIRDKVGQLNPREIEACTRLCDMVLKTLPKPMKGDLEEEIKGYKDDIRHKIKDAVDTVNEVINTKNLDEINHLLKTGTLDQKKLIQTHLVKTCQEIVTTIEKKWMEEDTQGALSMLKELFRYKVLFKENIQEFNHFFSTARNTLVSNLNKYYNDIITSIDSLFCDSVDANGTKWMVKLLDFMLQCIELKKDVSEMKENKDKEELLPDNFNDKIKGLNAKLISFFFSLYEKRKKMFQDMNSANEESAFFQKVKTFMKRKAYCNISEEMKLLTYSEIKRDFNSQLQKLLELIVNESIINNKTMVNDTERDRFFKHLKAKLDFVKQISQWNSHVTNVETLKKCPDKLEKEIQNLVTKINLTWTAAECDYINLSYSCLSFMQKYSIFENVVKLQIEAVDVL